jgi:hypothetical protein
MTITKVLDFIRYIGHTKLQHYLRQSFKIINMLIALEMKTIKMKIALFHGRDQQIP